ncbi:HAMP domain-containing histidine kinase, partial [bacterium]|nr:HAMP domain-containing histidine kinase [bacterium]
LDHIDTYLKFEEFKGLLKMSAENGLKVIELVRDMRDLVENGLAINPVNLSNAVDISSQILSHVFSRKNIQLEIDVSETIIVFAEEVSLVNSVLNNLFTNSIKFSHSGSKLIVKASVLEDKVILTITDFGVGIPLEIMANLFDINHNSTCVGTDGEKGNGFGMPLVYKFMTAYGGHIDVSSKEEETNPNEHGTVFTLTFQTTPPAVDSARK